MKKKINRLLKTFMDNRVVYDNPYKVEMLTHPDDSVCVAAFWPDYDMEGFNLELLFESDTIAEFTKVFGIGSIEQLDHITPEFLMDLYQQGKAYVCCAVDIPQNYYPLQFLKKNGAITATDDYNVVHEAPAWLETPQQFINYTQERFLASQVPNSDMKIITPL